MRINKYYDVGKVTTGNSMVELNCVSDKIGPKRNAFKQSVVKESV